MVAGKNVMVVRSHQLTTVHENVDLDGVITINKKVQKFRGKPTSVSLYVKLFQGEALDLILCLDGASHAILAHCLNEIGIGGECWVVPKALCKKFDGMWSKASVYNGVKQLQSARLIFKLEDYHYMVNPYYAAIGSDAEVKELRQRWDSMQPVVDVEQQTQGEQDD